MHHQENIRETIQTALAEQGLLLLGIVDLDVRSDFKRFSAWLEGGMHAEMGYLEQNTHCREVPENVLPGSKCAIVFALNYFRGDRRPHPQPRYQASESTPKVAQYARMRDYHKTMKFAAGRSWQKLAADVLHVEEKHGRVLVDSAPLLERSLAAKTSRGFIGKNTCYIHPDHGSFLLLGEIITTVDFPIDPRAEVTPRIRSSAGGCGTCKRCQVACPTGALNTEYILDARKCISYWTIEHRGPVPEEFWPHFNLYYFGCDICQSVCPYNRGAQIAHQLKEVPLPPLDLIATMDQEEYVQWFGGTPMTRAKRDGLQRNALIAMTVRRDAKLPSVLEKLQNTNSELLKATIAQISRWQEERR